MKYFLKLKIFKDNKEETVHYFVPDVVSIARTIEEGYTVTAHVYNEKYTFSVIKNRIIIGKYKNDIEPGQVIEFKDDGYVLEFSLLSVEEGKEIVREYLKPRSDITAGDMETFYLFVGEPENIRKKSRSYGPLYSNSGMDPDLKAEYEKGEDKKNK